MADMADFALGDVMDAEDDRFAYIMGDMSDGEAYERGIIDEMGGSNHPPILGRSGESATKQCAHCGVGGLQWVSVDHDRWRLADHDGNLHTCTSYSQHRTQIVPGSPGTISGRFRWLCNELEKRVGTICHLSSAPPEAELIRKLDELLDSHR